MRVCLVTHAPPGSLAGNRVTALRWARILRQVGHRVTIRQHVGHARCDVLVALHAHHSFASMVEYRRARPRGPLVVALTGTDLYGRMDEPNVRQALELADRLVVLQPEARRQVPARWRDKTRVIYQSVVPLARRPTPRKDRFEVCILGHLRAVKDPFRAALAARRLPRNSRIRLVHVGAALSESMARRARREETIQDRYQWLGALPHGQARRRLARSRLMVLSSRSEGGANAIGEALVDGVPILASRIPGSIGLLGPDYPGYFAVGDTLALARLLYRAETDAAFYAQLGAACQARRHLFKAALEQAAWRKLLGEFAGYPGESASGTTATWGHLAGDNEDEP